MNAHITNISADRGAIIVITADMIGPQTNFDVRADAVLIMLDKPPTAEQASELIRAIRSNSNSPGIASPA